MSSAKTPTLINQRYRLIRLLGSGGMGEVWLVEDILQDNRKLALKKILIDGRENSPSSQTIAEFLQSEFSTLNRLRHPNLAEVYDFDRDRRDGSYFFTSEFIDGSDLKNFFDKNPSPTFFLEVVTAMAQVLSYLHNRGYWHLDIKPSNFLVCGQSSPLVLKLVDFGTAHPQQQQKLKIVAGTPKYMAPELFENRQLDNRADLYSLGITLKTVLDDCFNQSLKDPIVNTINEVANRLNQTAPEKRLSDAGQIIDLINLRLHLNIPRESLAARISYVHAPQIIGREKELSAIHAFLQKPTLNGKLLLLHGSSGVGKTRLANEIRTNLQTKKIRCIFKTAAPQQELMVALARELMSQTANIESNLSPSSSEQRLAEEILEICRQLATNQPLVVIIDDIQVAEHLDKKIFTYLSRSFLVEETANPITLIGIIQDEHPGSAEVLKSTASLPPHQLLQIELKNFSQASQVKDFLNSCLGEIQLQDTFVEHLWRLSGGNPLFLEAFLKSWLTQFKDLKNVDWQKSALKINATPKSLRTLIDQQLKQLVPEDRQFMEVISLLTRAVTIPFVLQLIQNTALNIDSLHRCLADHWLKQHWDPQQGMLIEFEKELVKDLLSSRLSQKQRLKIHRHIVDTHKEVYHSDQPEFLSYHYLSAALINPGLELARKSLLTLINRSALQQATQLIRLMLPLEKDRQHKSELQLKMAEVSSRLGRFDEAKHQLQMLLLTDKQNGIAFLQLVELAKKRGNIQEVKQLSKRAGRIKLNELQQLELSQLQAETDTLAGNYPTAIDKLKAVVTRLADRKASTTHCRTYNSLGLVYFYLEKYDEAIRWLHLAQKLAQQLDLPLDKVTALYRLGMVQIRLRRTDDALKVLLQAKELAKAIGDLKQLCNIELNLGTLYQAQNDVSSALNSYQEGLRYATHMDDHTNKIISHFNLATLQHFLGAYTKAKSSLFMPLRLSELYHQNYFLAYSRLLTGVIESEESFGQKAREKLLLATRKIFQLRKPQDLALCYLELARNDLQQKKLRRARFYLLKLQKYLLTNPHQLLQAQSQWLLAQTAFYSPEEATKNFEELCDDLEQDSSLEGRDLLWKIEFTLSQYYLQLRETTHSQSLLRQSRDSYKKLLKLIPKNYQNEFSSSPTRRSLLNEIEAKLSEWTRTGLESSSIDELSRVILNEQESLLPILEISRKLNSLLDLKSLLDFIMNIMMSMTGAKHGYLLITSGSSFETFAERNLSEEESRASHSIAKLVMKSGTPLITHDAMHDERLEGLKTVVDLKLRSILCLPFRLKGEIIGVLYLEHRTRSNAFQNDTVRVLEAIADQAAIAIHNARLHSTSIEQEKKIRQLNRQLQAELEIERQRLKESERLVNSQQQALAVKFRAHNIITRSKKMRQVLELVEKVGDSDATILIQGESGTGKELIARAIHYNGRRKLRPFLTINCSALTETLLESELFGHEKGSFTGANRLKKGLFEMADSGTLFLDEVGDMSMSMQVKLLRVLQENEIRRVGGQATIKIDVRIISATNLDIDLAVKEGRFREDLFYRLNTIRVQIPPLRQRREDIPLLVRHILSQSEKPQIIMAAKTLELLSQHSWPGNVRELQNELERALIFADQEIRPEHLSPTFLRNDPLQPKLLSSSLEEVIQGKTLDQLMGQLEKEVLVTALKIHQGRKGITAQELGVTRFTLYRKLKEHGLGEDD